MRTSIKYYGTRNRNQVNNNREGCIFCSGNNLEKIQKVLNDLIEYLEINSDVEFLKCHTYQDYDILKKGYISVWETFNITDKEEFDCIKDEYMKWKSNYNFNDV